MAQTANIGVRVPPDVYSVLSQHAQDCNRTLGGEARGWLEVGSLLTVFATLIAPRSAEVVGSREEVEELRVRVLGDLQRALDRALPHRVSDEVIARALMPVLNMN